MTVTKLKLPYYIRLTIYFIFCLFIYSAYLSIQFSDTA